MYFLFQTIGAFFGAAVIFGMYYGKDFVVTSRSTGFMFEVSESLRVLFEFPVYTKHVLCNILLFASIQMPCGTILGLSM